MIQETRTFQPSFTVKSSLKSSESKHVLSQKLYNYAQSTQFLSPFDKSKNIYNRTGPFNYKLSMPKPDEFKTSRNNKLLFGEDSKNQSSNIHKGIETQRSSQTVKDFFHNEVHESFNNDSSSGEEMDGDLDEGYATKMNGSNPENTPELGKFNSDIKRQNFITVNPHQNETKIPSNDKIIHKNKKDESAKHKKYKSKNLTGPKQNSNLTSYQTEELRNEGK